MLDQFLNDNKSDIQSYISDILNEFQSSLSTDADTNENESIDIRLCIDRSGDSFTWIIRIGLADYDQKHSEWCAASSFDAYTKANELTDHLIKQID